MAGEPDPSRRLRIVTDPSGNPRVCPASTPTSDELVPLVERAVAGERDAFDELVCLTHRDAFGLALRMTGDEEDARDVVQDAYLRAYKSLDRFRGDARFTTWLYRIVANCASTQTGRRRRHRHEQLPDDSLIVDVRPEHDPVLRSEVAELRARVDEAVQALPPRLRAVVVLRDIHGMPHVAIAEELGISVSAAKVRLHRARGRLRERVFPLPGEELHAV